MVPNDSPLIALA
jgi:hypothetical protein